MFEVMFEDFPIHCAITLHLPPPVCGSVGRVRAFWEGIEP